MRGVLLLLAAGFTAAITAPLAAQDAEKKAKPAMKKPVAGSQKAHQKPSKDQIRKFNDLEKKQQ